MKPHFYLLIFLFSSVMATAQPSAGIKKSTVPYGNNPRAGKYYDIRGFKMYAEIYGQGQPLLLIHGNSGGIADFSHQIPYFSQHYRVIAVDSRAQGKSTDKGDSLSYEMMADDYAALLDTLQIKAVDLIGWSDGGINGLLLAMRRPDLVHKLAITGANLWPDSTAIYPEVIRQIEGWAEEEKKQPEINKNKLKLFQLMLDQPKIRAEALQAIECPVLVIGGDHDVIKESHTMDIYLHIPRAYLWILPASGHSTLITYREDFNRTVYRFLQTPYRVIKGKERFD